MEHAAGPSTGQILLNIGVQVLNLVLFFWLFVHFVGKKVVQAYEERKALLHKLANADDMYQEKLAEAQKEVDSLLVEATKQKQQIIAEGTHLGQQKKEEILTEASHMAQLIRDKADHEKKLMEADMEKQFTTGVKTTAALLVKKLLDKDPALKEAYIDTLVTEVTKK